MQKNIDLGEYKIKIIYDPRTSDLSVQVYDEMNELIESIDINDEDDEDDDDDMIPKKPNFNLN